MKAALDFASRAVDSGVGAAEGRQAAGGTEGVVRHRVADDAANAGGEESEFPREEAQLIAIVFHVPVDPDPAGIVHAGESQNRRMEILAVLDEGEPRFDSEKSGPHLNAQFVTRSGAHDDGDALVRDLFLAIEAVRILCVVRDGRHEIPEAAHGEPARIVEIRKHVRMDEPHGFLAFKIRRTCLRVFHSCTDMTRPRSRFGTGPVSQVASGAL